jgi:pimeloyl-ACP methyl ester carboxylesterase
MKLAIALLISPVLLSAVSTAGDDVASGHVEVDNGKIFYESAGKGPALVFLHDGLVHREVWQEQFSHFAGEYRVVRYDRRGYGNSSPAQGTYSSLDDLDRLFTALGIDKACLIGMSAGGALAIDFTLIHPDRVSGLVLVGAVVGGFPYTKHFLGRGGHLPPNLETDEETRAYYARQDPYTIHPANEAVRKQVARLVEANPIKGDRSPTPPRFAKPSYRRLGEIKVPAYVLVGEFDIPDVHAHAGAIQAGIVDSNRDIIPGAGHLVPIEQPERFNAALEFFLTRAIRE